MIDGVKGPYWDRRDRRWKLRWNEGGKARAKTAKRKQTIIDHKARLLGKDGSPEEKHYVRPLPKSFDGSPVAYKRALARAAVDASHAAADGNVQEMMVCRRWMATLSEGARASALHDDHVKTQEELAKLVAFVEGLYAGKVALEDASKPTILQSPASTLKGRKGPETTVH